MLLRWFPNFPELPILSNSPPTSFIAMSDSAICDMLSLCFLSKRKHLSGSDRKVYLDQHPVSISSLEDTSLKHITGTGGKYTPGQAFCIHDMLFRLLRLSSLFLQWFLFQEIPVCCRRFLDILWSWQGNLVGLSCYSVWQNDQSGHKSDLFSIVWLCDLHCLYSGTTTPTSLIAAPETCLVNIDFFV